MQSVRVKAEDCGSLSFLPPSTLYLLKVFVCKINGQSGKEDDRQHKDDIELISEMLQN